MAVRVEHSVVIERPVEQVFAALTDFENEPRWQPAVLESRHTPPGPVRLGTRTFQARTFMGRRVKSTSEVTAYEPDHLMVCTSTPDVSPAVQTTYRVERVPEGTRVFFTIVLETKGAFSIIAPLVKRGLTKDVVTRFQTLKGQLEG